MAEGGAPTSKQKRVESLGWLTESSIMPKKQKAISGVGVSSIVELKAQLYQTQEDVRRIRDGDVTVEKHRAKKKVDIFAKKNSGVEHRANSDKLHLKSIEDGSASYAALEKKAELYEKLVKGELSDEEEKEKYSVDFLRKGFLEDEAVNLHGVQVEPETEDKNTDDDKRTGIGWNKAGCVPSYKELVREVNRETNQAREKASMLKQRRQHVAEKSREKLRQAFMKKQLERLKAMSQTSDHQISDAGIDGTVETGNAQLSNS